MRPVNYQPIGMNNHYTTYQKILMPKFYFAKSDNTPITLYASFPILSPYSPTTSPPILSPAITFGGWLLFSGRPLTTFWMGYRLIFWLSLTFLMASRFVQILFNNFLATVFHVITLSNFFEIGDLPSKR